MGSTANFVEEFHVFMQKTLQNVVVLCDKKTGSIL